MKTGTQVWSAQYREPPPRTGVRSSGYLLRGFSWDYCECSVGSGDSEGRRHFIAVNCLVNRSECVSCMSKKQQQSLGSPDLQAGGWLAVGWLVGKYLLYSSAAGRKAGPSIGRLAD